MTARISPIRRSQYVLLLLPLTLLWPAIINGGAFYFADTSTYIRGVDAAFNRAFGWQSPWTEARIEKANTTTHSETATTQKVINHNEKPVLLGRSPYYGIIPYVSTALLSSDWLAILIQALVSGFASIGIVRHFIDPKQRGFGITCIICFMTLALTPLPFFASILMPDFMAGVGIIAAATLVAGWQRERPNWRVIWLVLILAATLMHSANVLIIGCIAIVALIYGAVRRSAEVIYGSASILLAVALGLTGEAAFTHVVTRITGSAPIRPPFVTARLIEDGPGLAYLDRTCPRSGFTLCRFRDRMPHGSDTFLWSTKPEDGVFTAAPPVDQRALSTEQGRFVREVAATFPLETFISMTRAAARQFYLFGLPEFNYPNLSELRRIPKPIMRSIISSRAYSHSMPVIPTNVIFVMIILSITIISLAMLSSSLIFLRGYCAVIMIGLLVNNFICGALSTPHDRYQARIIWLLPLIATLIILQLYRTRLTSARRSEPDATTPISTHRI